MKVTVDETCIVCGVCEQICPEVFSMGDDRAQVNDAAVADNEDCVREAAESCPTESIQIEE